MFVIVCFSVLVPVSKALAIHGQAFIMIRVGSLCYSCIYWSRFETLSAGYKSSAISHLVFFRLVCMKANSYSNFVVPSHLQLTCVKFSVATMHHLLQMPKVTSPLRLILLPLNRLSHHLLLVCPSVAKSICTFPRPRACATQWIVLAFLDTLRRSTSEPSQYFEKLSLPCFTVTSSHHVSYTVSPFAWSVSAYP